MYTIIHPGHRNPLSECRTRMTGACKIENIVTCRIQEYCKEDFT